MTLIRVRPILFHLPFDIPFYPYGFLLTVSVIAGRLVVLRRGSVSRWRKRRPRPEDRRA